MSSSATSSSTDDTAPPAATPPPAAAEESEDANGPSPPRRKLQSDKRPTTDLRIHAAIAAALAVAAVALSQVGPSLHTVVNFFWPLLVSTGVFLAAVAVLRVVSPPQPDGDAVDKAGSDLMDFVAGVSVGDHKEPHGGDGADAEQEEGTKGRDGGEEEEHQKHRDPR